MIGIKCFDRTQQAEVAFFNEILKRQTTIGKSLGEIHHQAQVGTDHVIASLRAVLVHDLPTELALLLRSEQLGFIDLAQIKLKLAFDRCFSHPRFFPSLIQRYHPERMMRRIRPGASSSNVGLNEGCLKNAGQKGEVEKRKSGKAGKRKIMKTGNIRNEPRPLGSGIERSEYPTPSRLCLVAEKHFE